MTTSQGTPRAGAVALCTFKRFSANGVVRLFSRLYARGQELWLLVAKREAGGTWKGVPGLARRMGVVELMGGVT